VAHGTDGNEAEKLGKREGRGGGFMDRSVAGAPRWSIDCDLDLTGGCSARSEVCDCVLSRTAGTAVMFCVVVVSLADSLSFSTSDAALTPLSGLLRADVLSEMGEDDCSVVPFGLEGEPGGSDVSGASSNYSQSATNATGA